jgi:hypothetical protein
MIWSRIMEKLFNLTPQVCQSCESLKLMLDRQLDINRELTNSIISQTKVQPEPIQSNETFKPISPLHTPWRVRQQLLENEDRAKAAIMRKTNEELEQAIMAKSGNPGIPLGSGGAIPGERNQGVPVGLFDGGVGSDK